MFLNILKVAYKLEFKIVPNLGFAQYFAQQWVLLLKWVECNLISILRFKTGHVNCSQKNIKKSQGRSS